MDSFHPILLKKHGQILSAVRWAFDWPVVPGKCRIERAARERRRLVRGEVGVLRVTQPHQGITGMIGVGMSGCYMHM
jgi:hypothetical protein